MSKIRVAIAIMLMLGLTNCSFIGGAAVGAAVVNNLGPPPPGGWCFDASANVAPCRSTP